MGEKKRHTVTTIETHEFWFVRRPAAQRPTLLCAECPGDTETMLTPKEAAERVGVNQSTVYRWAEEGRIHFSETPEGNLLVCLAPLTIDV